MGIVHDTFFDVAPDPTLEFAIRGAEQMRAFQPDTIIALGGGSAMDAGKIMWVLYEHPEADFMDMAMRFIDIRKRIYTFPKMGEKAYFIAIPTSAGTGSEVTPFAVITDEKTGVKYPLADYELLPKMAITIEKNKWIRGNGDIWYRVNKQGQFAGDDYQHLTLEDLINAYRLWKDIDATYLPIIEEMIASKAGYLSINQYGYTTKIKNGLQQLDMMKYLPLGREHTDAL